MLTCLVPVLFTFYIQSVLKLKKNNSGAKGLILFSHLHLDLPGGPFASGSTTKFFYILLISPVRATCSVHLIFLHLMI